MRSTICRFRLWFIFVVFALSATMIAQQAPVAADAYTSGANTGVNYGSAVVLFVTGPSNTVTATNGVNNRAWVSFDLNGLPAATPATQVAKATLTFYVNRVYAPGSVDVMLAGNSWTETGITDAAAPVPGAIVATGVPVSQVGYVTVDVTSAVQAWLGGYDAKAVAAAANDGLVIVANSSSPALAIALDSKESTATSHPAQLQIALTGPAGPQGPAGPVGLQGPPGTTPTGAALTGSANTFTATQTVQGNVVLQGGGNGIVFPDGSVQKTAATGSGVSTDGTIALYFSSSAVPPAGATLLQTSPGGSTKAVASMPTALSQFGTVVLGGKVITFGGQDVNGNPSAAVNVYDPATNTWSAGAAPLPVARQGGAAVSLGNYAYLMGGYAIGQTCCETTDLLVYDPNASDQTKVWTAKAKMPIPRRLFSAVTLNGKIYTLAGLAGRNDTPTNEVDVYDPATDSWSQAAPLPETATVPFAGVVNGKIYAADSQWSHTYIYDPSTNQWNNGAPFPTSFTARYVGAGVVSNGRLYAFGGYTLDSCNNAFGSGMVAYYDPSTDAWSPSAPLLTGRGFLGAAPINSDVFVLGGELKETHGACGTTDNWPFPPTAVVERYSPSPTVYMYATAH